MKYIEIIKESFGDKFKDLKLNTSNKNKLKEFERLGLSGLKMSSIDLPEPDADPLTVIRSKASQAGPGVIVEDTSLDVEGHPEVGVNIRWLVDKIQEYKGSKAEFRVLLGILLNNKVFVYEGLVRGVLVEPRGSGFGFDPMFLPVGSRKTLGEEKSDEYNPRAIAVKNFLDDNPYAVLEPLHTWKGKWQH